MKVQYSFWIQIRGGYGGYDWDWVRAKVLKGIEHLQPDPARLDEVQITLRPDPSSSKPNGATADVEFYV